MNAYTCDIPAGPASGHNGGSLQSGGPGGAANLWVCNWGVLTGPNLTYTPVNYTSYTCTNGQWTQAGGFIQYAPAPLPNTCASMQVANPIGNLTGGYTGPQAQWQGPFCNLPIDKPIGTTYTCNFYCQETKTQYAATGQCHWVSKTYKCASGGWTFQSQTP